MKGLDIAHAFWHTWGQPFLAAEFPELSGRVAAGRILGSDVIGADDEISRDHNWGPQFSLFLSAEDYAACGMALSEIMNAAAPNPWQGHRLAGGGDKSVEVAAIPGWFEDLLGIAQPPQRPEDWRPLQEPAKESILYFLRHAAIWADGTGEFTGWRTALAHYPEAIHYQRLAEECFRVWQHGEYNFVQRMSKRRDPLAIAICLGEFTRGVMQLQLLLQGEFVPYWKWLAFAFRQLPEAAPYVPLLEVLNTTADLDTQVNLVLEVSALTHAQLLTSGAVTGEGATPGLLPLLNDHIELKAHAKTA